MPFTLNISGQLKQIKLESQKALWPLFETVVNSLQSLEDINSEEKRVVIEAIRTKNEQLSLDLDGDGIEQLPRYEGFIVSDNGIGFDTCNYRSFLEAYSQLKVKKGCKGIGRFLWLKAFESVRIESTYYEDGKWCKRLFEFKEDGISPEDNVVELEGNEHKRETKVQLVGFKKRYSEAARYSLETLARKMIEHCLLYFIAGSCPQIVLKDVFGEEIVLNAYFEQTYKDSLHRDSMDLKGHQFTLYHMLLTEKVDKHELHLCANHREVKSINVSLPRHIPNMPKALATENGSGYYVGYLAGDCLDNAINSGRNEFDFSDMPDIDEEEIVEAAVGMVRVYLHEDIEKIADEKRKQIDAFVQSDRPQYRFLLNSHPEVYDEIPAGLSEDKLDLELYKHQQKWELDIAMQKKEIEDGLHKRKATDEETFQALFERYCQSITNLSRASLAEYVARRKAVIDLLENALELDRDGHYNKESTIHSIFCPMQVTSDEIKYDDMNLWLIDDRLAYHRFLASDKKMKSLPVLENTSEKRADIVVFDAALSYTADPDNISSITIVEMKRPMRDDHDDDDNPVSQVLRYVKNIKDGKVKKPNGRGFGNVKNIAFYCYVIADITPSLAEMAALAGLTMMQDGEGYFGYNSTYGAYIEVLSYEKVLKNAKQRNRVLFDKLFEPKSIDLMYPGLVFK